MPLDEGTTHEEQTVRAVRAALTSVPFYVKQGLTAPPDMVAAPLSDILSELPLLTRDKIRPTLPKVWFPEGRDSKAELAAGSISVIEIGTGESRLRALFDRAWWRAQEKRALTTHPRAASAINGETGAYREAVLWVPEKGTGSCGSGDPAYEERLEGGTRLHLNSRQDPTFWTEPVMTRMLDEIAVHETTALLADPFYLDVLARHAAILNRRLDVRGFIATTRARATAAQRDMLARVFPGTVIDVLAAREVGTLFVQGADQKMHHAPFGTHVELLPAKVETPGAKNVALVVVTTLDRAVMPLVRYVLGDLVQVAPDGGKHATTGVPSIVSVEGSLDDAIVRPDGALITSGAIDRAIGAGGARGYQVVQTGAADVELEVIAGNADALRDSLAGLFAGMKVTARAVTAIGAEPNGKYRTSRRAVPVTLPAWT